jgi:tRNA 5-methylaminomethyl-2-thiouridine biosynthesis bifunctional protein
MKRDNTPWAPTQAADVGWTDDGDPISRRFEDVYYSREDGAAESRQVFLQGNNLPERWSNFGSRTFRIAETGFGTGLNFLLTWESWLALAAPRPRLHYLSIEKFPLRKADLTRALAAWPELAHLAKQLLQAWPGRLPGQHRVILQEGDITLDLWWEDVNDALEDMSAYGAVFDAWYLDGFAPARNEAMWQDNLYPAMAALSRPGASFATFTAAGRVRRGLQEAGFTVAKVPGFGRKRECLRGSLEQPGAALVPPGETPWDLDASEPAEPGTVLVVGGGIAGCFTAATLARRGIPVTLLEQHAVASEASGNEQGILYTRLSRKHSTLTDFALQSFNFSATRYRQMFAHQLLTEGQDGALCGSFHQHTDCDEMATLKQSLEGMEDLASVLNADEAAALLGLRPATGGFWFPGSGWLRPPSICQALLQHPLISLREHCGSISLQRSTGGWEASAGGKSLATAPHAIICTGTSASDFPELSWLPLQAIRGQTTQLPESGQTRGLKAALCHEGYISPGREGQHCIGATFKLRDPDRELRAEEHLENIQRLASALPQWREQLERLDTSSLAGRVGFRCASPDYLPIAGRVPARDEFLQAYAGLRKNARHPIPRQGPFVPGLYVNTAHGSRGLSSAPLVAEWIASDICAEPRPLSRELARALSPARFLIRDLSRNRI